MPDKLNSEAAILDKLDTLIRLQAHAAVTHLESQKEKILFLNKVGMSLKEIADIVGTTPNTVNVTLSKARKASRKPKTPDTLAKAD
jgi:DNA-directed RNA polymerase specialized sigma24 family protein